MSPTVLSELQMADAQGIEDLVDREALTEVCRSFFDLFGLSIRLFSNEGALLADVHQQRGLCGFLNGMEAGRNACTETVSAVRTRVPDAGDAIHPCFTGAVYRVLPISYDGRRLGRMVVGPYVPAETVEPPKSLLKVLGIDSPACITPYFSDMPRVRKETAERITRHVSHVLDLLLFSGHRAFLTSNLHLLSVRENFRELTEKTEGLQRAYDKLKELDRLKSGFLATVSHELRTPLTSIIGYSEMLASGIGGELNDEHRDFVNVIRAKGETLLELITSLLDMSKFEQGQVHLRHELLDVAQLVAEVALTVAPHAKKRGVQLEQVVEPALPKLSADIARLRQVLQNLIDNALKFTPSGGKVSVEVSRAELGPHSMGDLEDLEDLGGLVLMMAPKDGLRIVVRDTGIGIPREQHERIFNEFYQIDSSATREHGGTGLGLSIVRRIVEAHGGTIRVESEPGQGAAFIVQLPLSADQ